LVEKIAFNPFLLNKFGMNDYLQNKDYETIACFFGMVLQ